MAHMPCYLCDHWVADEIIGVDEARRLLAEHTRAEHGQAATFPPESKLFVLDPTFPQGSCPSGKEPAPAGPKVAGTTAICRTCHRLPCTCPQDVIRDPNAAIEVHGGWRSYDAHELRAALGLNEAARLIVQLPGGRSWQGGDQLVLGGVTVVAEFGEGGQRHLVVPNGPIALPVVTTPPAGSKGYASIMFSATSMPELAERVRAWLVKMDGVPVQGDGREGNS